MKIYCHLNRLAFTNLYAKFIYYLFYLLWNGFHQQFSTLYYNLQQPIAHWLKKCVSCISLQIWKRLEIFSKPSKNCYQYANSVALFLFSRRSEFKLRLVQFDVNVNGIFRAGLSLKKLDFLSCIANVNRVGIKNSWRQKTYHLIHDNRRDCVRRIPIPQIKNKITP